MLNVTSTWKDYLLNEDYELYLTLSNQTLINRDIPNSHILQDSFSMNRFSVTGSTIEIGAATAAEVQFTVDNSDGTFDDVVFEGAEIHIKLRHFENKGTEQETSSSINIGVAYVDEVVRHQDSIQLVCLDKMVQLDKPVGAISYSTPLLLISDICSACGLNYNSSASSLVNANVTIAAPTSENLTYRALLQWVCQITGTCAYIDSNGSLVLNWYDMDNAQDDLTVSNRFSSEIDREAITVTGVSVTVGDTQYASSNDTSYMISVEGNELISADNVSTIVSGLAARINGFTYYPFSAQTMNLCWLQPLDTANYVDKNGADHPIIITDWTFSRGRNLSLSGKGESATRKGYASNPPFTAAQQRIIEEIKKNVPDSQIDDKIAAVFALNEAVNNGVMLHETTVGGQKYYHDGDTLADSNYIAVYNSGGFAWTKDGWNDGNPTFEYGLNTSEAAAILESVTATKINADLLTAGEINADLVHIINLIAEDLEIKNGNTIIHKFSSKPADATNYGHEAVIGGANGITYDDTHGVHIGSDVTIDGNVSIGGSATIGEAITDAVDDALTDLELRGIDYETVEYAISTSGSDIPSGEGTANPSDTYYVVLNSQSDNYLSTIETTSSFNAAHSNNEIFTAQELFSYFVGRTVTKYIYQFDRTESADGEFLLGNWTYVGKTTAPSYSTTPIVSKTLYGKFSSEPTDLQIKRALLNNGGTTVRDNMMFQMQSGDKCYSFTAVLQEQCNVSISNITEVYEYGSSDADVIETYNCFSALSTSGGSSEKNDLKSSIDGYSQFAAIVLSKWNQTNKYFYRFSASVLANGEIVVGDNYRMMAEYGSSYPVWRGESWSSTMPDVSVNKGKYLWTRTVTTYTDGTTSVPIYQATYIGKNGSQGSPGQSGISVTIISIKYAKNQDQSSQPLDSSFDPTVPTLNPGDWLWTKTTYSDGNTAVTKTYIGNDGADGDSVVIQDAYKTGGTTFLVITDGTTTETLEINDGADGDTGVHVHFAWADNLEFSQDTPGTFDHSGFTTSNQYSTNKPYIGVCANARTEDPQDPGEYSWTLVKGADGVDGKGIYNTVIRYGIGSNGTSSSSVSSWTSTIPDTSATENKGKYLWTRTQIYYTTAPSTVGNTMYSVAYIANDGEPGTPGSPGSPGSPGVGVYNVDQYFFASSSDNASSLPSITPTIDSQWKRLPSELSVKFSATNKYLWSFTKTIYTDTGYTTTDPYIIGTWGQDSSGGGADGRGILSITPQYALSTSSSSAPSENSSLWQNEPAEYPASVSTDKSVVTTAAASNSMQSILAGISLKKDVAYNVTFAVEGTLSSAATFYLKNSSGTTLVTYARTTSSITATYTPTSNLNNCYIEIYTANQEVDCAASVVVARYYYWQRDEIAWTDNTTSHTEGVLSQGFNAAIYGVNRLNTAFIEAEMGGLTQVFFDAGHIYADSLTAYNVAAFEALIKHLMANQVDVDGNVSVVNGDITITQAPTESGNMPDSYLNSYCQAHYGKNFSALSVFVQPFAASQALVAYVASQAVAAANAGKLTVKNNAETIIAALYPNALVFTDSANGKYSLIGNDSTFGGNVKVGGSLTAGNIQKGDLTVNLDSSGKSTEITVTFDQAFTYPPVVTLSVVYSLTGKRLCAYLTQSSTTGFKAVVESANWGSTGSSVCVLNWIAIS